MPGQLGLEPTPAEYVERMVEVFRLVRDVLADDGTVWLNLGDSYNANQGAGFDTNQDGGARKAASASPKIPSGLPAKNLLGLPWRLAFALQADGWVLRQDIIWHKPNPMPESVTDRCTKAHEYVFLLAKSQRYFYDADAIAEQGKLLPSGNTDHKYVNDDPRNRTKAGFLAMHQKIYERVNRRSVWSITTEPYPDAHFACFPTALVEPCILAGSKPGDVVLDPFLGSGTVAQVAQALGRHWIGCELNPEYVALQSKRTQQMGMALA
jgi:DNA modification methylase